VVVGASEIERANCSPLVRQNAVVDGTVRRGGTEVAVFDGGGGLLGGRQVTVGEGLAAALFSSSFAALKWESERKGAGFEMSDESWRKVCGQVVWRKNVSHILIGYVDMKSELCGFTLMKMSPLKITERTCFFSTGNINLWAIPSYWWFEDELGMGISLGTAQIKLLRWSIGDDETQA
jgi:hypothetical protein